MNDPTPGRFPGTLYDGIVHPPPRPIKASVSAGMLQPSVRLRWRRRDPIISRTGLASLRVAIPSSTAASIAGNIAAADSSSHLS